MQKLNLPADPGVAPSPMFDQTDSHERHAQAAAQIARVGLTDLEDYEVAEHVRDAICEARRQIKTFELDDHVEVFDLTCVELNLSAANILKAEK